jgi:hypothetical protein
MALPPVANLEPPDRPQLLEGPVLARPWSPTIWHLRHESVRRVCAGCAQGWPGTRGPKTPVRVSKLAQDINAPTRNKNCTGLAQIAGQL